MTKENRLDVDKKQLNILKAIIKQHIPDKSVWVYGSRVTWKASATSDLDLAVFACTDSHIFELKEALEESDLLFSVDVMNWEEIPENFRRNIKKKYVVLQAKNELEGWREVKLGDVVKSNCQNIGKDYEYSQILYLDTGSITAGRIKNLDDYQVLQAPSRAKRLVKDEDIVYSNVRPIQRHYGFIKNPPDNLVVSTGFSVIETDRSKAESLFIYHLLASNHVVEKLDAIAEGATSAYPALRPADIEALEILLPPLPEQKAIAEVLSSLDDKIDLLHRQNKTLEDMAQTLFRKWFIDEADDNWEEFAVSDIAEHLKINVKPAQNPASIYYHYSLPAYDNSQMPNAESGESILSNKYEVVSNSILVSKLNPRFPRIWAIGNEVEDNSICSTEFQVFKPINNKLFGFLFFLFKSDNAKNKLKMAASGTSGSHQRVRPEDILNISFRIFSEIQAEEFSKLISPNIEKLLKNKQQISTIETLRDTLLPKLMSGRIRIRH